MARPLQRAIVAVGGNEGNVPRTIHNALKLLGAAPITHLGRTSFMYKSKPMYVERQAAFLNCAVEVYTQLEPLELLRELKEIEKKLGRIPNIKNGPRPIDLDLIVYEDRQVHIEPDLYEQNDDNIELSLHLPHLRLHERGFVLKPLNDIDSSMQIPGYADLKTLIAQLPPEQLSTLQRVTPIDLGGKSWSVLEWGKRTLIMSIFNMTTDSFSGDGLLHKGTDALLAKVEQCMPIADVIDIGAESTRPGATQITTDEEQHRLLPAIDSIKRRFSEAVISVDTFHASTARAACNAGASIINDVSGGSFDQAMFSTAAQLAVPYCLMHMRGTMKDMNSPANTEYGADMAGEIKRELSARIKKANHSGIYNWNIIADPGLGFSKTPLQNLRLLTSVNAARPFTYPMLIGASRKGFLKRAVDCMGSEYNMAHPADQILLTAAASTAAIASGADMLRVHDIREMNTVTRLADALYRAQENAILLNPYEYD